MHEAVVFTYEQPEQVSEFNPVLKYKVSVFSHENKVNIVESSFRKKVVYRNGGSREYRYWITNSSMGVRRLHTGTLTPYWCRRSDDNKRWVFSSWFGYGSVLASEQLTQSFSNELNYRFGITKVEDIYPVLRQTRWKYSAYPNAIRPLLRSESLDGFALKTTGLVRAGKLVDSVDPNIVGLANQVQGLVPEKSIIRLLQDAEGEEFNFHDRRVGAVLKRVSPACRIELLKDFRNITTSFLPVSFYGGKGVVQCIDMVEAPTWADLRFTWAERKSA